MFWAYFKPLHRLRTVPFMLLRAKILSQNCKSLGSSAPCCFLPLQIASLALLKGSTLIARQKSVRVPRLEVPGGSLPPLGSSAWEALIFWEERCSLPMDHTREICQKPDIL
jgi:hypothetical protein